MKEKKKKVKVVFESEEIGKPDSLFNIEVPIFKAAEIKVPNSPNMFFFLEKKGDRPGFTFNYTPNLIPDGFRLKTIKFIREDEKDV